jgi:hypothetical protein
MSVESNIAKWESQSPICRVSSAERKFIADMRAAAAAGVGYGWMQQVCEWEWQEYGLAAWGPEYFQRRIDELEAQKHHE